jgi:hypothetical protein
MLMHFLLARLPGGVGDQSRPGRQTDSDPAAYLRELPISAKDMRAMNNGDQRDWHHRDAYA